MLRYAMYVTVNIIFIYIHFDTHSFDISYYRHTYLAPERIKKSFSGPRPKKVVHPCFKLNNVTNIKHMAAKWLEQLPSSA